MLTPSDPSRRSPGLSFARCLAVAAGLWIVHLTLLPMHFDLSPDVLADKLRHAFGSPFSDVLGEHAIVFGVFGFLAGMAVRASATRVAAALVVALLLLEGVQLTVVGRHARPGDWAINSAAAVIGLVASRRFDLLPWFERNSRRAAIVFVVLGTLATTLNRVRTYRRFDLTTWDPGYSLLLGDELGGGRAWRGAIASCALYPSELSPGDVARLWQQRASTDRGLELRKDRAVAVFVPGAATTGRVGDRSSAAVAAPLFDQGRTCRARGGVWRFDGTSALESDGDLGRLCTALSSSPEFSVELDATSSVLDQIGPARIVSFSKSIYLRNFTVGQSGDALVFRVRSPAGGENGTKFEARWPNVFAPGRRLHLFLTYRLGDIHLYVGGRPFGRVWSTREKARAVAGIGGWAILVALISFFPLGWGGAIAWPAARAWARRVFGSVLVIGPSLVASVALGSATDLQLDLPVFAWGVVCFLLGDSIASTGRPGILRA